MASLQLLLAAVLVHALALRWLLVVRRRIAFEHALAWQRATQGAARSDQAESDGEAAELQFDEPEADLSALSDNTRGLIRISIGVATVAGLLLTWADALPALRAFDQQALWHTTLIVDGLNSSRPSP